jgi:hypothetical protein
MNGLIRMGSAGRNTATEREREREREKKKTAKIAKEAQRAQRGETGTGKQGNLIKNYNYYGGLFIKIDGYVCSVFYKIDIID